MSKHQQIKNSFIYLYPVVLDNFLPLLILPFFTRILTPEDYGVYALVQVYAMFVNGFTNMGLIVSYERNYFQYKEDRLKTAQLFFSIVSFVFLLSCLGGFLTYFFRNELSALVVRLPQYGYLLVGAFGAQALVNLRQYYLVYFRNEGKAHDYSLYYLICSLSTVAMSFLMVVFAKMGVAGLIYSEIIANIFILGVLQRKFVKNLGFRLSQQLLFESLKISYPLIPRLFFGVISTQFDKYMLGLMSTLGGVGIFNLGQKISYVVFIYMTSLQNVFQPHVYKMMFESKEGVSSSIGKYLTPFIYISIFIGILVALFSEEIVFVLAPPIYYGAVPVIIILAMYYGFLFSGKIISLQLLFRKKSLLISILSIVTIVLNILVNIPFIFRWGANGAAWATFLTGLISGAVSWFFAQRCFKIEWEYRKIFGIFSIFFGASIGLIVLREVHCDYWARFLFKLLLISVYFYQGIRWGILNRENFNIVRKMFIPKPLSGKVEGQR